MKLFLTITLLLASLAVSPQKPGESLATATGHTFTKTDLSRELQNTLDGLPTALADARQQVLAQLTSDAMIDAEAKTRGTTTEKLKLDELAKAAAPSEAEITQVYQANLAALENKPLSEVRKQIVQYLRQSAFQKFTESLKAKHKVVPGKDVNAPDLKPTDVLATVNGRAITVAEFNDKSRIPLYNLVADVGDLVEFELSDLIYQAVVMDEARTLSMEASDLIAREVTNKIRDFTDDERIALESALRKRLFAKYAVKILYRGPKPIVESIATDDDPSQGPADAPVTIVMFSDFQCPACSATHPILKKVMAEYPGKIRFVVRDFPLMSIHENSFNAARAANVAKGAGKFFEYIEILYTHQNALDVDSLRKYAGDVGIAAKQFDLAYNAESNADEIRKDMANGAAYILMSTPTIFVNGVRVRDLSVDGFRMAIDTALKK